MAVLLVKIILIFFFIRLVILEKRGYVSEVKMNMKTQCVGSTKEVFTVKREMQCVHYCLRKRCNLLNYNTKGATKDNCEVMKKVGKCTELSDQSDWKLMSVLVRDLDAYNPECFMHCMISR